MVKRDTFNVIRRAIEVHSTSLDQVYKLYLAGLSEYENKEHV